MTMLRAGAARRSLAPRAEHLSEGVWLGGFGAYRQRRATGVLDAPECRALALDDGAAGIVIAALDMVGAAGPLLATIRERAAAITGLSTANILVSCTHSHASPDTQALWGGVPGGYAQLVAEEVAGAIGDAWGARRGAELRSATTVFDGLVRNRRDWPMTDTALTVLRVLAADGSPIGTLVNYACHPTAIGGGSTEVSRDWCGVAADIIDREAGGVTVYVNGAIGDANPLFSGDVNHARTLGQGVAAWALEATQSATRVEGEALEVQSALLQLPLNMERLESGIEQAIASADIHAGNDGAMTPDDVFDAGRPDLAQILAAVRGMRERDLVTRDGKTFLRTMCSRVRVGDVEMVSAPGEMTTRLALPVRSSMRTPHRMILGLTHDTLGYFIPRDEFMTGRNDNYEESVSMGFQAGALLSDALSVLIDNGWHDAPDASQ